MTHHNQPDLPSHGVEYGRLALSIGKKLPLQVLKSNAGHYIGTADENGPCSRESNEYFRSESAARLALAEGSWTQKDYT